MDYATLIAPKSTPGSVAQWANSNAIPSSEIVVDAESWVYERLRVTEMLETITTLTFTTGSNAIARPANFCGLRTMWITGDAKQKLTLTTPDKVLERTGYENGQIVQAKPSVFYVDKENFIFNTRSDAAYATWLVQFGRQAALSGGNLTNFLTVKYSRMFRLVLRGIAFEWMKDGSQLARDELAKASDHIERINMESMMELQNLSAGI